MGHYGSKLDDNGDDDSVKLPKKVVELATLINQPKESMMVQVRWKEKKKKKKSMPQEKKKNIRAFL